MKGRMFGRLRLALPKLTAAIAATFVWQFRIPLHSFGVTQKGELLTSRQTNCLSVATLHDCKVEEGLWDVDTEGSPLMPYCNFAVRQYFDPDTLPLPTFLCRYPSSSAPVAVACPPSVYLYDNDTLM